MADKNELDFGDLTLIEKPVVVAGKAYTLREATGDASCKYRNAVLKCTRIGPDGTATALDNLADVEPLLVSLCLVDDQGHHVHQSIIRSWPSRVVKKLFEVAKNISELGETDEDEEAAKNVPSDSTGGSA